jgi:hypothetical protein
MTFMRQLTVSRVVGLLFVGALGCGLINSDVTKVTFDLPSKTYSFDSSKAGVPANFSTVKINCGTPDNLLTMTVMDCCNPPAASPIKPNCTANPVKCESAVCTLEQPVTVVQSMNLKNEVPQLMSVNDQHLANISLETLHYEAMSTLNVDIPALDLYLGPSAAMGPMDAGVIHFGTVPAIAHGTSPSGDVVLDADADATFSSFGYTFGTPFNFIASTTVRVPSGSPAPTGMVTVTVSGKIAAKLAL